MEKYLKKKLPQLNSIDEQKVDESEQNIEAPKCLTPNFKIKDYSYLQSDLPPWESLYRQFRETGEARLSKTPFVDFSVKEFNTEKLTSIVDIVKYKFRSLRKLGPQCNMWIFYEASRGLIRSDKNKRVWVSNLFRKNNTKLWTPSQRLNLRKRLNSFNYWTACLNESVSFKLISDITLRCNQIYSELLMYLSARRQTMAVKHKLENLRELPEFVDFQTYRTRDHKHYKYCFAPTPQGGNNDAIKAARPLPVKLHSVHGLMMQYHNWLGKLKA